MDCERKLWPLNLHPRTCETSHAPQPVPRQSQASKANGKKSRGPSAPESKRKSSLNSTKSGLRSQTVGLAHEPAQWSERGNQWHDYYKSASPGALHLINQCARFTLLSDRADEYQTAELQKQVRETKEAWHRKQRRRVRYLAGQIRKDPWGRWRN